MLSSSLLLVDKIKFRITEAYFTFILMPQLAHYSGACRGEICWETSIGFKRIKINKFLFSKANIHWNGLNWLKMRSSNVLLLTQQSNFFHPKGA
jgi:hypothetical protein